MTTRVPQPGRPESGPEERGAASRAGGAVLGSLLGHGEDYVYENMFLLLVCESLKRGHGVLGSRWNVTRKHLMGACTKGLWG